MYGEQRFTQGVFPDYSLFTEAERSGFLSVALIKYPEQQLLRGGRVCTSRPQLLLGSQGSDLGIYSQEKKEMNASMLLCGSLLSSVSQLRTPCPGNGAAHNGVGGPTSVNNQSTAPQTCLQTSLIEEIPHLRLSFQMLIGCCRLMFKTNYYIELLLNLEFAYSASLANHFALRIMSLPLEHWDCSWGPTCLPSFYVSTEDLNWFSGLSSKYFVQ